MAQLIQSLALAAVLSLGVLPSVQAHMEMSRPYSFRSKFNPANTNPDYSNTSPLLTDGSNYPCKGYTNLPESQAPVVTYNPGQTYSLTLAGSASHGGGSCQISLSYDNGQSFRVIKSIIGGCPLKPEYDFVIPSYAPPSQSAILAWTWFNHIGNREMYMQCARVAIAGGQSVIPRYRRSSLSKKQASINELPEAFKCNIGNGCRTLENHEISFPNPGNVIETGVNGGETLAGPGYVLDGAPAPTNTYIPSATNTATTLISVSTPGGFYPTSLTSTSSVISTSYYTNRTTTTNVPTTTSAPTATFTTLISTRISNSTTTTSTLASSFSFSFSFTTTTTTTTTAPTTSPTLIPGSCTPGTFACNSPTTWSQCITTVINDGNVNTLTLATTYIYMGNVAAGMQCVDNAIVRAPDTSSSSSSSSSNTTTTTTTNKPNNDNTISLVFSSSTSCTPVGVLQCTDTRAFHTCVNGDQLDMGPVPAGMNCINGQVLVSLS